MKKIVLFAAAALSFVLTSCWYNHKWDEMHPYGQNSGPSCSDTTGTISYSVTVKPIIQAKCATAGCHVLHSQKDYNSTANVQADGLASPPDNIMSRISLAPGTTGYMPDGGTLTDCEKIKIRLWIQQGCLDN